MTSDIKKKTTAINPAKKRVAKKTAISAKEAPAKNVTRKTIHKAKETPTEKVAKKPTIPTKPNTSSINITSEQRRKMIAIAAYHKAEKRGFAPGNELQDWAEAEKEVDELLISS
jgi:hypothetical protein